jgi:ketosteroid isomerase-like protein
VSANLDLVRAIFADWERGDFRRTDWADPEIEMVRHDAIEGGVRRGLASTVEGWRGWLEAWDNYRARADEYRALDGERVVVFGHMEGRGRVSGASVETEIVNVFHLRDGKVTKLLLYTQRDRALADLGLDE